MFAPLEGWRHVKSGSPQNRCGLPHVLEDLAGRALLRELQDHRSVQARSQPTSTQQRLHSYEAFPVPPAEAQALVERFDGTCTPKPLVLARLAGVVGTRRPSPSARTTARRIFSRQNKPSVD